MANEYGRWFVHNDPQTWRKNIDGYKRPFSERYERPSEYTPSVEAYRHYPAIKDIVAEQEEKKKQLEQQDKPQQKNSTQQRANKMRGRQATQNIIKNVAGKVVAVVGGGAVVVAGYQAISAELAEPTEQIEEPPAIVQIIEEADADWAAWNTSEYTVMVKLKDAEGNVIKEIPASVTLTEAVAPTCTKAGSNTYTATAEDDGKAYTDSYTDSVAPTGHKWGEGKVKTAENGDSVMVYECSECHEEFEVKVSAEEND